MYGYQAVMEANGKFVGRVGVVLDPIPCVIEHLAQRNFDQMWRDAEIALCRSKFAGPAPDTFEHAPMQALEKTFSRRNFPAAECPAVCRGDILLLKFVQFAAQSDVGRDEILTLFR